MLLDARDVSCRSGSMMIQNWLARGRSPYRKVWPLPRSFLTSALRFGGFLNLYPRNGKSAPESCKLSGIDDLLQARIIVDERPLTFKSA